MSHIEQALKQAGIRSFADRRPEESSHLEYFPALNGDAARVETQVAENADSGTATGHWSDALIVHEQVPRICTEQFRTVAGALHQKQRDTGMKRLMITSAHANEGKTFTVANLSYILGESYRRRVLLVDADLRRPCLHTVFGVANTDGLSDSLRRNGSTASVHQITPWLSLMPAGTPESDPMPLLTSGHLQPLLHDMSDKFDWVILDAPPAALLPDAALLISLVDSAVLVIAAGVAPYRSLSRTIEALGRQKIAGVVLNRAENRGLPEPSYETYYTR